MITYHPERDNAPPPVARGQRSNSKDPQPTCVPPHHPILPCRSIHSKHINGTHAPAVEEGRLQEPSRASSSSGLLRDDATRRSLANPASQGNRTFRERSHPRSAAENRIRRGWWRLSRQWRYRARRGSDTEGIGCRYVRVGMKMGGLQPRFYGGAEHVEVSVTPSGTTVPLFLLSVAKSGFSRAPLCVN